MNQNIDSGAVIIMVIWVVSASLVLSIPVIIGLIKAARMNKTCDKCRYNLELETMKGCRVYMPRKDHSAENCTHYKPKWWGI